MRVRFFLVFSFFLFSCGSVYAAFERKELGARAGGLSGSFSALSQDASAPFWNVAGLSQVQFPELQSYYTQLFSVQDLSLYGASAAVPLKWKKAGSAAIAYSHFGNNVYSEQEIYLSHGIAINDYFQVGTSFKTMLLKIDGYGSSVSVGVDLALQFQMEKRWTFATLAKNINRPKISNGQESLSQSLGAAASFLALKNLMLSSEIERGSERPINFKFGVEWTLWDIFILRSGAQTSPSRFGAGFGLWIKNVRLDYSYEHNMELSATHQITLVVPLGARDLLGAPGQRKTEKTKVFGNAVSATGASTKISAAAEPFAPEPLPEESTVGPLIDLQSASEEDLEEIPKIGTALAREIIKFRSVHGIQNWDDVLKISKMQKDTFFSLKQFCTIGTPMEESDTAPAAPSAVIAPDALAAPTEPEENLDWPRFNEFSTTDLRACGLSEITAENILRYRSKKGNFHSKKMLDRVPWMDQYSWKKLLLCVGKK